MSTTTNVGGFTPRGLDYIKAAQALLAKADGRDKLVATLQYAAMFAAAGSPGKALNVQKSLSNARKPFRVLKPLEALLPVLTAPPGAVTPVSVANKLKALSWAVFFSFDHVVWAHSVGLVSDKSTAESAQKHSFYGWLLASLCALAVDVSDASRLHSARENAAAAAAAAGAATEAAKGEAKPAADAAALEALRVANDALRLKLISAATSASQAAVAASLLKLVNISPRQTAALGILTSVLAVYQLLPPLPPAPPPLKPKAE